MIPLKKPATGSNAFYFDITVMPNKAFIAVEANVNLAGNQPLLDDLDAIEAIESMDIKDPYTIIVRDKSDNAVELTRKIEVVLTKHGIVD
jgi:hypothetical protein